MAAPGTPVPDTLSRPSSMSPGAAPVSILHSVSSARKQTGETGPWVARHIAREPFRFQVRPTRCCGKVHAPRAIPQLGPAG